MCLWNCSYPLGDGKVHWAQWLGQGWQTFLRVCAQPIYKFWRHSFTCPLECETWRWIYEVSSNSIQIGTVVAAHWVGCVCNQSSHVRTCLSNSWHKLQVAAFAQLAVVGHGSNMCVYVIAIFTMSESTKQCICIKFCFKIGKTATETETYQLLQQA